MDEVVPSFDLENEIYNLAHLYTPSVAGLAYSANTRVSSRYSIFYYSALRSRLPTRSVYSYIFSRYTLSGNPILFRYSSGVCFNYTGSIIRSFAKSRVSKRIRN